MEEFGFWEKWGMELNDQQFANALAALGIVAAATLSSQDAGSTDLFQSWPENDETRKTLKGIALRSAIFDPISHSRKNDFIVPWHFPLPDQRALVGGQQIPIATLNPREVAGAWETLLGGSETIEPRLHISRHPAGEAVRPWFRMLFETSPRIAAAYIDLNTPEACLNMKWPLRLGYLPGNSAEEFIQKLGSMWPSRDLARPVRIDRDNANCDVLLFSGSLSQLLRKLLEPPVPQKTNLFLVRGAFEEDLTAMRGRLAAAAAEARAGGFIFPHAAISDEVLLDAVNRFVENLSHNQSMDVAVSEAFTKFSVTDPVIFMTRELAAFKLEQMVKTTCRRLESLPKAARPPIDPDSFTRMGVSVDSVQDDLTNPEIAAATLRANEPKMAFSRESSGATGLARINDAIDYEENQVIEEAAQKRFLQEQVFIRKEGDLIQERAAFRKGVPTLIRVRIAPPDEEWVMLAQGFPEEKLPRDRKEWNLAVVLTEPNHLKAPLRGSFKLPQTGPSGECEFRIQPGDFAVFEARITVLHRGRVLQTGVLRGRVVADEGELSAQDAISFTEHIVVRSHIGDLEGRRQFDAAFVLNHNSADKPQLTTIAANHAWLMDISNCKAVVEDINAELTKVAMSVEDYRGGLGTEENVKMLVKLAQLGRHLYGAIVMDQLKDPENQSEFANLQYLQIVSTKTDALLPLEFIYNAVAPSQGAKLCPEMAAAVKIKNAEKRRQAANSLIEGRCRDADSGAENCTYRSTEFVCPTAFWGISKVIERHMASPRLAQGGFDFYLQSEATTNRSMLRLSGTAVVAASAKVKAAALKPVLSACKKQLGAPAQEAKDWNQWVSLVSEFKPHVLLALPHTDGNGVNASLEIGGKTILSGQITDDHVHAVGETTYPLVALLGCDTAGTALDYGNHVSWFRRSGAALVISTIAKVFGLHAAAIAEQLVKGLRQETDPQERVGEILRSIKRQALIDGSLMALCIVAFGDADWKLN
jgi:hypothetical protein